MTRRLDRLERALEVRFPKPPPSEATRLAYSWEAATDLDTCPPANRRVSVCAKLWWVMVGLGLTHRHDFTLLQEPRHGGHLCRHAVNATTRSL